MDTDIAVYFHELPGHGQVAYKRSRGPNDLWAIKFTVSGFDLRPTMVLVADAAGYGQWRDTGATSGCHLVEPVNWSLDTQVELDHATDWYLVLNNTVSAPLYYTLVVTHYHWGPDIDGSTTVPAQMIGDALWWLFVVAIIVVVIPCVCNCACTRWCWGDGDTIEELHQHHYLVLPQQDEEDDEEEEQDYW